MMRGMLLGALMLCTGYCVAIAANEWLHLPRYISLRVYPDNPRMDAFYGLRDPLANWDRLPAPRVHGPVGVASLSYGPPFDLYERDIPTMCKLGCVVVGLYDQMHPDSGNLQFGGDLVWDEKRGPAVMVH